MWQLLAWLSFQLQLLIWAFFKCDQFFIFCWNHIKRAVLYMGAPSIFKSASSPTYLPPILFWDSFSPSPLSFWSACLSAICLFKFLLNKMGIASCLFVRKFCLHLLFTSFIFLRYLQQILAGCTICVINKTAVKILTVWSNCQPWLGAKFIPERMLRCRTSVLTQDWPLQQSAGESGFRI